MGEKVDNGVLDKTSEGLRSFGRELGKLKDEVLSMGTEDLKKLLGKLLKDVPKSIKDIAREKFESSKYTVKVWKQYCNLKGGEKPDFFPFFCAYKGYEKMERKNGYLMIVDYSKPVNSNRCYLINMKTNKVEITTTCEQGIGRKGKSQPGFSNEDGSWKSSIGISQTEQPIPKENFGIRDSLVVSGKEHSNSMSAKRHILVHNGSYSKGCFVFKDKVKGKKIINCLANYGTIFSYYPDANYLRTSQYV